MLKGFGGGRLSNNNNIKITGNKRISDTEIPESLKKYSELEENLALIQENNLENIISQIEDSFSEDEMQFIFKRIIFFSRIRPTKLANLAEVYAYFALKYPSQQPSISYIVDKSIPFARKLYEYGVLDFSKVPYSQWRKQNNTLEFRLRLQRSAFGSRSSNSNNESNDKVWAVFFDVFNKDLSPEQESKIHRFTTGYNEGSITEAIKYDDIAKLQAFASKDNFNWDNKYQVSQQDYFQFYDHNNEMNALNVVQLAAFYGAVNCFKFAMSNNQKLKGLQNCAIIGGNNEIIHALDQNNITFKNCFLLSIRYHHFGIADWLLTMITDALSIDLTDIIRTSSIKALLFILKDIKEFDYFSCISTAVNIDAEHIFYAFQEAQKNNRVSLSSRINRTLVYACKNNNLQLVKKIFSPELLNSKDNDMYDSTPLDYACKNGNLEMVKFLIDKGAQFNEYSSSRNSPLSNAISSGNLDLLKFMFEKGAKCQESETPMLIKAINTGDLNIVRYIYEKDPNIEVYSERRFTPEYYAVTNGYLDILIFLINHGAKLLRVRGDSLISFNISDNNFQIIKLLLEYDCEKSDSDIDRLFSKAVHSTDPQLLEYLIDNYPIPQNAIIESFDLKSDNVFQKLLPHVDATKNNYTSALVKCISNYGINQVKQLVEKGVDVNGLTYLNPNRPNSIERHHQPLITAIQKGDIDVIQYLLDKGARVEPDNDSDTDSDDNPLVAAAGSSLEIFQLIISKVKSLEKYLSVIISTAINREKIDIFEYILQKGYKIPSDIESSKSGALLRNAIESDNSELLANLIEMGIDPNTPCSNNKLPLQVACRRPNTNMKIIQFLIDKKVDVNQVCPNTSKRTPLCICLKRSNIEAAKLLLQNGADPNILSSRTKRSCLHQAIQSNIPSEMLQLLLDHGAKIDSLDNFNRTPLFYAHSISHAKFLIEHGADVQFKDKNGNSPLHNIVKYRTNNILEVVKYLIEKGADPHAKNIGKTAEDYARNNSIKQLLKAK